MGVPVEGVAEKAESRSATVTKALGSALLFVGTGFLLTAHTWVQAVVVVALPFAAGLVLLLIRSPRLRDHLVAWSCATVLVAAASVVAFKPEALFDEQFCDYAGSGPLRVCVRGQGGADSGWAKEVATSPGGVVLVKAEVEAFDEQSDGTVLSLDLPDGLRWVDGGGRIATSQTKGRWASQGLPLTGTGVNVGSYAPGGAAYVSFAVGVEQDGYVCGTTDKIVQLKARSSTGSDAESLVVKVERVC